MAIKVPPLTLGIEEEYQIIDPQTRNLTAYITQFLEQDAKRVDPIDVKKEFMQSQVEIGSTVCNNIQELRLDLERLRRAVIEMADENGTRIVAASTHPFAKWADQYRNEGERYKELHDDMAGVAERLLIFGMHVHVGFGGSTDKSTWDPEMQDLKIEIMNQARYFIPHLLALSTSSPFWQGKYTGLKSYRSVVFEMLPRTGIPPSFSSWADYDAYESILARAGSFEKGSAKLWWDIRPHPLFDTLEFRIADLGTTVDEAVCLAALFQAVCAKLLKLRQQNMSWRPYRNMYISENKWRAMRYGIDGELIDFGRKESRPLRFLINELLELVDDVVDDLGSREEVNFARKILETGSSADRQLKVYHANGGDENNEEAMMAVVDHLIEETRRGL